jgi:hypothetical protein
MAHKPTLLIDFDGVLHQYKGWKGEEELDPPIEKARHAMLLLEKTHKLVCFTTRPSSQVEAWLRQWGFPLSMKVTNYKQPAFLQIDDRAICFQGTWTDELLQQIKDFKPYWQGETNE